MTAGLYALFVLGGLLLVLGLGGLVALVVPWLRRRFRQTAFPSPLLTPTVPAHCAVCNLTIRPRDRESHDKVCAGLSGFHKSDGSRTTILIFHEAGDVRVLKYVGPFACFGMRISEVSHGDGPTALSAALAQVSAELRQEPK